MPCPPPGDLSNSGIEPRSPALQADSLAPEPPGKPKNTGVGGPSFFQGVFPTQESNHSLLHCRQILYQLKNAHMSSQISQIRPTNISEGFFSPISFLSSASSTSTGHCLIGQVLLTCGSDITSLPSSIWHHHYPHQAFHSKEERLHLFYSLQREISGQESLACCSPWACEESDKTEQLNNHREVSTHSFLCPSVSRNS